MKSIWKISLWVLVLSGICVAIFFVNRRRQDIQIRSVCVHIRYEHADTLLTERNVKSIISSSIGDIQGKSAEMLESTKLEENIEQNPFVEQADVYLDFKGNLQVNVKQREPIVRVCDQARKQYYIDKAGHVMPLSTQGVQNVMLANGFIQRKKKERKDVQLIQDEDLLIKGGSDLEKLVYIASYVNEHPFFRNQLDQIYVNSKGEYELVCKLGNQIILLGDVSDLRAKLDNLYYLYRYGFSNVGWDQYKMINLKFENQVVCTKYENNG